MSKHCPSLLTHIGYGGWGFAPVAVEVLFAGVVGEEAGRPRDQLGLVATPALAALHHRHSQEDALDYAANIFRVFGLRSISGSILEKYQYVVQCVA